MKNLAVVATFVASLVLVACGRNEPPKATPAPLSSATTVTKAEPKKDEAPHAPDTHGMPGMSELFKGDDKPADKAGDKAGQKAGEKK